MNRQNPDSTPRPLIIAHRGASKERPENTLAAFERALELGADGIEFDVQLTKDGYVVVMHDENLERTTNGRGLVKDHTLDELLRLDAGTWFGHAFREERIPTLEEVLELARNTRLINVELKNNKVAYEGLETKVIGALKTTGVRTNVVISSFNHASLVRVKSLDPSVRTATLHEPFLWRLSPPAWIPVWQARRVRAEAIHLSRQGSTVEIIRGAHAAGLEVRVWTVNAAEDVRRMVELGADGIITDDPDGVKSVLARG